MTSDSSQGTLTKIERLLRKLEESRAAQDSLRAAHYRQALPHARMLHRVPLVHGVSHPDAAIKVLRERELLSRVRIGKPPFDSEQYLGMKDSVYTSAGVLYPKRQIALVFSPSVEDSFPANATPWDTGAFHNGTICRDLPAPPDSTRRRVFQEVCLPSPEYRDYLVEYVATCFRSALDYLKCQPHVYSDPWRALATNKWQSRIFEVRFDHRLPIDSRVLLGIFIPRHVSRRYAFDLRDAAETWAMAGVDVIEYDGACEDVQQRVRAWIVGRLEAETRNGTANRD